MQNHHICSNENKEFGPWVKVKHAFPYGWFFNYYELKHGQNLYVTRENKLDKFIDWICNKMDS